MSNQSRKKIMFLILPKMVARTHLVKVDDRLPELILEFVKIPHSNLSEVSRMVPVQIRSVMVLTTSHTTSTWMLAVLSYTTVTSRDVTTAVMEERYVSLRFG